MDLVKTPAGHLLIWERGTTRYTLGYRFGRFKWFVARRWVFALRRFSCHFIAYPMTEVEIDRRGLTRMTASSRTGPSTEDS